MNAFFWFWFISGTLAFPLYLLHKRQEEESVTVGTFLAIYIMCVCFGPLSLSVNIIIQIAGLLEKFPAIEKAITKALSFKIFKGKEDK